MISFRGPQDRGRDRRNVLLQDLTATFSGSRSCNRCFHGRVLRTTACVQRKDTATAEVLRGRGAPSPLPPRIAPDMVRTLIDRARFKRAISSALTFKRPLTFSETRSHEDAYQRLVESATGLRARALGGTTREPLNSPLSTSSTETTTSPLIRRVPSAKWWPTT